MVSTVKWCCIRYGNKGSRIIFRRFQFWCVCERRYSVHLRVKCKLNEHARRILIRNVRKAREFSLRYVKKEQYLVTYRASLWRWRFPLWYLCCFTAPFFAKTMDKNRIALSILKT